MRPLIVSAAVSILAATAIGGPAAAATTHTASAGSTASTASAQKAAVKTPTRGLEDRKGFPTKSYVSAVRNFVVEARWADVQPHGPSELVTAGIDSEISQAAAAGLQVKLRVTAGADSPGWVRSQAGSVVLEGADGVGKITVPRFWNTSYIKSYDALQAKLAARYDANQTVRENYLCGPSLQYCEPSLRFISRAQNRTTMLAAGYTVALDAAAIKANMLTGRYWTHTPVAIAFNPYQPVGATAKVDVNATVSQMKAFRTMFGCRAVLANHSLNLQRGADYQAMYAEQKKLGAPLAYQTSTAKKIGDWEGALRFAVSQGASSVELPSGYNRWSAAVLQTYTAKLAAAPTCR